MMKNLRTLIVYALILASLTAFASKPKTEKGSACAAAVMQFLETGFRREQAPSPSTLIPLSTVLLSQKDPYVAYVWRQASVYDKRFASQGLAQVYATADKAAEELIEKLGVKPVRPIARRNPWEAAAETLTLMESKDPPKYIRSATIIRDGVVMVAPLLKREDVIEGRAIWSPIVAKGHQDLRDDDILQAAFIAWGLEPWQGKIPEKAFVYIKPMATKRTTVPELRGQFEIDVADYLPQVKKVFEDFMSRAEEASTDPEILTKAFPDKRAVAINPWGPFYRTKLSEIDALGMMPLPPSIPQTEALKSWGFGTMKDLANVKVNSDDFFDLSLKANIQPERLKYFIAHAIAKSENQVVVMEPFVDPFKDISTLVHIDFEDILDPKVRSGVYLFGIRFERVGLKTAKKEFIWAEKEFSQKSVDDAWYRFFSLIKDNPDLKGKSYKFTTYSKHEIVKVEQQFDILKDLAEKFTSQQRASEYYSEVEVRGKMIGRFIRNKDFFAEHKKIKPADVFYLMDNTIDLLDYPRNNLAFPSWSNSIKKVVEYADAKDGGGTYASGLNGLESVAWALKYYETGEVALRDKIQAYNGLDVENNQAVRQIISRFSGNPEDSRLIYSAEQSQAVERVSEIVSAKAKVVLLDEKQNLLSRVLGKEVNALSDEQIARMKQIFDRSEYLKSRREIQEASSDDASALENLLQAREFEDYSARVKALNEFVAEVNPAINAEADNPATQALGELMAKPSTYLTANSIDELLALLELRAKLPQDLGATDTQFSLPDVLNVSGGWGADTWATGLKHSLPRKSLQALLDGLRFGKSFAKPN